MNELHVCEHRLTLAVHLFSAFDRSYQLMLTPSTGEKHIWPTHTHYHMDSVASILSIPSLLHIIRSTHHTSNAAAATAAAAVMAFSNGPKPWKLVGEKSED